MHWNIALLLCFYQFNGYDIEIANSYCLQYVGFAITDVKTLLLIVSYLDERMMKTYLVASKLTIAVYS